MTLEQLEDIKERLNKSNRSITAMINAKERKRNKTPEDYRLLREYQGYKNELNAYIPSIPSFRGYYGRRKQQGRGIFYFNNPSDLLKRLELLDGSLRAGNNGVFQEYILIIHKLRDLGVISNTKLKSLITKLLSSKTIK